MSLKSLTKKMNLLAKTNKLELIAATTMQAITADRIFDKGKDSTGGEIGKYSKGYLKQRIKDNYPPSTKVILQATRQMSNDWTVINTGKELGLGFKNSFNADKSEWVEITYNKSIFSHTKDELDTLGKVLDIEIKKLLNG